MENANVRLEAGKPFLIYVPLGFWGHKNRQLCAQLTPGKTGNNIKRARRKRSNKFLGLNNLSQRHSRECERTGKWCQLNTGLHPRRRQRVGNSNGTFQKQSMGNSARSFPDNAKRKHAKNVKVKCIPDGRLRPCLGDANKFSSFVELSTNRRLRRYSW